MLNCMLYNNLNHLSIDRHHNLSKFHRCLELCKFGKLHGRVGNLDYHRRWKRSHRHMLCKWSLCKFCIRHLRSRLASTFVLFLYHFSYHPHIFDIHFNHISNILPHTPHNFSHIPTNTSQARIY